MVRKSPECELRDAGGHAALRGVLGVQTLPAARRQLERHAPRGTLDLKQLDALDTPGALLLDELSRRGVELQGVRAEHRTLLDLVAALPGKPLPREPRVPRWRELVMQLGQGADDAWRDARDIVAFVGRAAGAFAQALVHRRRLRLRSISRQVFDTGVRALPIVGLMAVMISVVIGYQGVAQLRPYGGEDFTVALVAVSMLREMGVLVTAIIVAGRSGSAFAAEIGVMRLNDEIDALRAIGLNAVEVLVLPRILGLVIALPLLTVIADAMGLAGGAVLCWLLLDIPFNQFLARMQEAIMPTTFWAGLLKAPVFAFVIAMIGTYRGMQVRASSRELGRLTTVAVVQAIFMVIFVNAIFAVVYWQLDF